MGHTGKGKWSSRTGRGRGGGLKKVGSTNFLVSQARPFTNRRGEGKVLVKLCRHSCSHYGSHENRGGHAQGYVIVSRIGV